MIPWQWYIKFIDADGTRPFEEVRAEVRAKAEAIFHLIMQPNTIGRRVEAARHRLQDVQDIYESFYLIRKQNK